MLDTVSKRSGRATLVYLSIVIALLSMAMSGILFYKASNQLGKTNEKLTELSSKLDSMNKTKDYQRLLESMEKINQSLQNVATTKDLLNITERITLLKSSINESQKSLLEQLNRLEEKVKSLEEKILFPTTVTDGSGDQVIIPARPSRIVSLAPSATEILYFVNATDRLVGVDSYSDFPEWIPVARENGSLIDVGGFWNPSVEAILSANPDLVIGVAGVTAHQQLKQLLKAYGIPVVLLPQKSLSDIKESILIAGEATGNIDEAVKAAVQFESSLSKIKYANYTTTPKVALIVWLNPVWTAGNSTFQSEAVFWAGGVNAFENYTGWITVSPEELVQAAPDIIVGVGVNTTAIISYLQQQLGDSAYQIPALANNQVYCIGSPYSDMLKRPSPRIIEGILALQLVIHPEIYGYTPSTLPSCINGTTLPTLPSIPSMTP